MPVHNFELFIVLALYMYLLPVHVLCCCLDVSISDSNFVTILCPWCSNQVPPCVRYRFFEGKKNMIIQDIFSL